MEKTRAKHLYQLILYPWWHKSQQSSKFVQCEGSPVHSRQLLAVCIMKAYRGPSSSIYLSQAAAGLKNPVLHLRVKKTKQTKKKTITGRNGKKNCPSLECDENEKVTESRKGESWGRCNAERGRNLPNREQRHGGTSVTTFQLWELEQQMQWWCIVEGIRVRDTPKSPPLCLCICLCVWVWQQGAAQHRTLHAARGH